SVLLISIAGLSIALALLNSVTDSEQTSVATIRSQQAQALASACIEEALQQINDSISFTGNDTLNFANGTCTYTVNNTGGTTREILASSTIDIFVRKVYVTIDMVNPNISVVSWQDVEGFGGGIAPPPADTTAPSQVIDLALSGATSNSLDLGWTAPGDDGNVGTATTYDIRYSTSVITAGNWASATQVTGEPSPSIAGSAESLTVAGLSQSTTYYFAMKTSDEVPNESGLSNVPSLATATGADVTAPAAITNLSLSSASGKSILLTWTAPGDDGNVGTATTYDIRYSTSVITAGNWASATQVTGEPTPLVAGTVQTMRVSGLDWNTTYYFAMQTSDEVPNTSTISNSPGLTTRSQASYLVINTATARSNAPTDNTQMINITLQNSATDPAESITISQMSAAWSSAGSRRLNTIRINGANYWTGTAAKGTLVPLSPVFVLAPSTIYPVTYLDYNNNIIGSNANVIRFIMSSGSMIDSSSFTITQ
ncbi:MAG: hypothetical protein AAB490_05955, partial [Patescibacteria group bacterium]